MRTISFPLVLAVAVSACGPNAATIAAADEAERAIAERNELVERYGADGETLSVVDSRGGSLAGLPATCGKYLDVPSQSLARGILAGRVVAGERDLGQDPAVFEELWRRAGCRD